MPSATYTLGLMMLSSDPVLDRSPPCATAECLGRPCSSMFPNSPGSCWDRFPDPLRWYPLLLYFGPEPYRSAEDPASRFLKRGLRQGMQAARMAVHISTVVLDEELHVSHSDFGYWGRCTHHIVRSELSNRKSPCLP
jgi:hypothetical protein